MARTKATIGYLATFSIANPNLAQSPPASPPNNFVPMLEVKSIKTSWLTVPVIDATHLLSPNATEEKLPGLIKPGTVEITGNFVGDDTQLAILGYAESRGLFEFLVAGELNSTEGFPSDTYTMSGFGFVSKYDNGPWEPSKLVEFSMTIEISGTLTEEIVAGVASPPTS